MITRSSNDEIYIGRWAGKRVRQDLEKAKKSVKIISPYLTPSYIEDLLKLAKKGIDVTLITSNNVEEGNGKYSSFSHTDLIHQKRHTNKKVKELRNKGMKYALYSLFIPTLLLYLSYYVLAILTFVAFVFVFKHYQNKTIYTYRYSSPIKLRVIPDEYHDREKGKFFIHSKVYVIDNEIAHLGSANYTYRGFKSNYETITRITSQKAVRDISREVDRLFNDKALYSKDIDEWAMEIYDEPRN